MGALEEAQEFEPMDHNLVKNRPRSCICDGNMTMPWHGIWFEYASKSCKTDRQNLSLMENEGRVLKNLALVNQGKFLKHVYGCLPPDYFVLLFKLARMKDHILQPYNILPFHYIYMYYEIDFRCLMLLMTILSSANKENSTVRP